ncbi:minichromosome maintenance protein 10 [Microdochium nivale]|nr:minichromosome maintenance protein 10 [Microdochium nivale]
MTAGSSSNEPQWPPRSPHEALLSTPGGREKLRRMIDRTSPSPSPNKRIGGRIQPRATALLPGDDGEDDDDDDEETLQLKLQAIQAQLKLKKLQKGKARKDTEPEGTTTTGRTSSALEPAAPFTTTRTATSRQTDLTILHSHTDVQVPASPVRRAQQNIHDPKSPSRIRLGIDKGLTARDISLKRVPSVKPPARAEQDGRNTQQSQRSTHTPADSSEHMRQPVSFGQRMQAARSDEASRLDRQARLKQVRTNAFGISKTELEDLKRNATDIPDMPEEPTQFSREDILSRGQPRSAAIGKVTTEFSSEAPAIEPYSGFHLSKRIIPHTTMARTLNGKEIFNIQDVLKHVKAPDFELPEIEKDIVIFGILASKSEPKAHQTKSALKEKAGKEEGAAKYMVMKLVDLQWELDLFLFGTGFDRYWKMSAGTVIAILNPTIMPPPAARVDTGKFSLVINSGEDTILEVGNARDLGFCKSVKRDGKVCDSWVNKKHTEFCEFHMNSALEKHLKARQDINAFNTGPGPRSGSAASGNRRGNLFRGKGKDQGDGRHRGAFDRETHSHWFLHKKDSAAAMLDNEVLSGRVTGTIERGEALKRRLATEEKERGIMKQLGKVGAGAGKEYMRLSQQKREVPVSGASIAYDTTDSATDAPRRVDARSLGLLKDKDHQIHLSPVKRKRAESALSGSFVSSSSASSFRTAPNTAGGGSGSRKEALGWGGGLKSKLSRMKDGENLRKGNAPQRNDEDLGAGMAMKNGSDQAPSRKKTRFVTDKGIRIAGRDSLGTELVRATDDATADPDTARTPRMVMLDDDDDDLLILDE